MDVPKPPFYSATDELLYNIYLKLSSPINALTASDINTLAKLNAILIDADLISSENLINTVSALKGNVPSAGNTLEKLYNIIQGLNYLSREDIDTLAEINSLLVDADLIRTEDLSTIFHQYNLSRKEVQFYFRKRASDDEDCHDQDRFLFRGKISSLSECHSNELVSVGYKTRIDSASTWIVHANLNALQIWIDAHVQGSSDNGTLYWIKCVPVYKQGKTGETGNLFSYQPASN